MRRILSVVGYRVLDFHHVQFAATAVAFRLEVETFLTHKGLGLHHVICWLVSYLTPLVHAVWNHTELAKSASVTVAN